jgi:hypothetical protein
MLQQALAQAQLLFVQVKEASISGRGASGGDGAPGPGDDDH